MNDQFKSKLTACSILIAFLLLVAMTFGPAQSGVALAEEDPWVVNPANGHSYRLTEPMSWFDAEAQAQAWGGHLVTLNNAAEETWIKDTFGRFEHFWIGFSDIAEEGIWVWSSGEPVTYTNWDAVGNEPNNCCECTDYPGCEDAAVMNWKADEGDGNSFGDYWNDLAPDGWTRGVVERGVYPVDIDIKPGSYPNSINLGAHGVVPMAVLSTPEFDAACVDPATIIFAGASPLRWVLEDVDNDGDMDLLFHFNVMELGLDPTSIEAILSGMTFNGLYIQGVDSVKIVP